MANDLTSSKSPCNGGVAGTNKRRTKGDNHQIWGKQEDWEACSLPRLTALASAVHVVGGSTLTSIRVASETVASEAMRWPLMRR